MSSDATLVFSNTPSVTVVIVNYNSGAWLGRTLARLAKQSHPAEDFEVTVVDNASSDGSEQACTLYPTVQLIRAGSNLGFAAANNLAVARVSSEWIVLLNPDAPPHRRWLESLLCEIRHRPAVRIFGSRQIDAWNPRLLDGLGDEVSGWGIAWRRGHRDPRSAVQHCDSPFSVCGAALMIRREDYRALGGFDERFFCYVEDVDLCYRARLRGWACRQVEAAWVYHASGARVRSNHNGFAIYHGYRNLVWLQIKDAPGWLLPLALLGNAGLVLLKSIAAPTPDMRRAYLHGWRDGWLQSGPFWQERAIVQKTRTVSVLELMRQLVWNPLRIPHRGLKRP